MSGYSIIYVALFTAGIVALLLKVQWLRAFWKKPIRIAVCAAIISACGATLVLNPENQHAVNSATGIPNFSVLIVWVFLILQGASGLAVALFWRHPKHEAWQQLRWIIVAYIFGIIAMAVFFFMSTVPEERPTDFVLYYANQPTAAMFSVLLVLFYGGGQACLVVWCFRWARGEYCVGFPWLRAGLTLYGIYGAANGAIAVTVLVGLIINWCGVDSHNGLIAATPPILASVTIFALLMAVAVPLFGPRVAALVVWVNQWRTFFLLRSFHRTFSSIRPEGVLVAKGRRFDPHHRVRRILIELNDLRLQLLPFFTSAIREEAERWGRRDGLDDQEIAATVEAAQLTLALDACMCTGGRSDYVSVRPSPDDAVLEDRGMDAELSWWIQVSRAYKTSRRPSRAHLNSLVR